MDRSAAFHALPNRYAYALRMRQEGLDDAAIARILALDPVAVRPFLAVAEVKVAELTRSQGYWSDRDSAGANSDSSDTTHP
jgi:hypothetical protein